MNKLGRLERWSRLRMLLVGLFALAGVAGIVWLLAHGLRKQEVLAVDGALLGLLGISLAVAVAELRSLERSKEELRTAQQTGAPPPESDTWVSFVSEHLEKLAAGGTDGQAGQLESLPSGADLVDSIRGEAERAAVTLRWFAGAAVLVGLLGTLFGLIDAIHGAVLVLESAASERAQDGGASLQQLSAALSPLGSAFVCSGAGVLASLILLLVRQTFESELDAHFSAIERWLDVTMPARFPEWRSPTARLMDVSQAMRNNNEVLLSQTHDVLQRAVKAIAEQLVPIGGSLVKTVSAGLQASSAQILGHLEVARKEELGKLDRAVKELTEEHRGAVERHLVSLMKTLSAEQRERLEQWKAAIASNQAWLSTTNQASMDERRAMQREYEAIRKSFDNEFRQLEEKIREQRKEMGSANSSFKEIGVQLASASETLRRDAGAFAAASGEITQAAGKQLEEIGKKLAVSTSAAIEASKQGIADAVEAAKSGLGAAIETSKELLASTLENCRQPLEQSAASLSASTSLLQEAASGFHEDLVAAIKNNHEEASAALATLNTRLGNELETASARMFNEALREQATLVANIKTQLSDSKEGVEALGNVATLFHGSVAKLSKETAQFAAASEKLAAAAAKAAKGAHESAEASKPIFAEQSRLSGDVNLLHEALVGVTQHVIATTAQAQAQSKTLAQLLRDLDAHEKQRSEGIAALANAVLAVRPSGPGAKT